MVTPTIKEPTGATPGGTQKWGGPDAVQTAQVIKGTHPTERIQHEVIEKQVEVVVSVAGVLVIDLADTTIHHKQITLFEDVAVSFINVPAVNKKIDFDIVVIQDATGGWNITFTPTPANDQPTINPTALETTILHLFTYNQLVTLFIELSLQPIVVQVGDTNVIPQTTVFANAIVIDKRRYRKLVVVIEGDVAEIVEYSVFGTSKTIVGAAPPNADESWFNLLNEDCDPDDYDPAKVVQISANATELKDRFGVADEPYAWIRVLTRVTSGTGNVRVVGSLQI